MDRLPLSVRANIRNHMALNPGLVLRWFGDSDCKAYIKEHFDDELEKAYSGETHGNYRGDLCRAAVLFEEGGFYVDLDVELKVPFRNLVGSSTSFMSTFMADVAILNALIATKRRSTVMADTIREVRLWYRRLGGPRGNTPVLNAKEDGSPSHLMGPVTMLRGVRAVMRRECPDLQLSERRHNLQWDCGAEKLRFYEEKSLDCKRGMLGRAPECPPERAQAKFSGLKFGLFEPGPQRRLVGWPRFQSCTDWGCAGGGHEVSKAG